MSQQDFISDQISSSSFLVISYQLKQIVIWATRDLWLFFLIHNVTRGKRDSSLTSTALDQINNLSVELQNIPAQTGGQTANCYNTEYLIYVIVICMFNI